MGKISKSKKTLALVMALVMAFTIVPFGAWGVIKASAESPDQQTVEYYKPATELKDGQAYVIVSETYNTALRELGTGYCGALSGFNVNTKYGAEALWEFEATSKTTGTFSHISPYYENHTRKYLNYKGDEIWASLAGDTKQNCTVSGSDGKYSIHADGHYLKGSANNFGFDGGSGDVFTFYEPIDAAEAAADIELPIQIRDLKRDGFMIENTGDTSEAFDFLHDHESEQMGKGNANKGFAYPRFLRILGNNSPADKDNPGIYDYRKGLTQAELNGGKLEYSPYAVIYVAHALREMYHFDSTGNKRDGDNFYNTDTGLGAKFRDKFTKYYWYRDTWISSYSGYKEKFINDPTSNYGGDTDGLLSNSEMGNYVNISEIEGYLFKENIVNFYNAIEGTANQTAKKKVDDFFKECINGTRKYESYDKALKYVKANVIATDSYAAIVADYAYTVSHANQITYDRVTNDNPTFDNSETWEYYTDNDWKSNLWWYKGTHYTNGGAGFMDVAYYLLNNYFTDNGEAVLNDKNELIGYTKNVTKDGTAASELRLQKVIKADGTVAYRYNSKFNSEWGYNGGTIANTHVSTEPDASPLNVKNYTSDGELDFSPINDLGFKNENTQGNYGFTLHGDGKFVYSAADNLYFDFTGDDDVFLYINNQKVDVDLGGVHGAKNARIYLNDCGLNLKEGEIYDFDFFYMERRSVGANLLMETNIQVMNAALGAQKVAYTGPECELNQAIPNGGGIPADSEIYYEFGAVCAKESSSNVNNIVFKDNKLGVELSGDKFEMKVGNLPAGYASVEDYVKAGFMGLYKIKDGKPIDGGDVQFADIATAKSKIDALELQPGEEVYLYGVPYKVTAEDAVDGVYANNLVVSGNYTTISGRTAETDATASSKINVIETDDKTIVIDFAGELKYPAEKIFTEMERSLEDNGLYVDKTVKNGDGVYGNATLTGNELTYTMDKTMTGSDEFTITETYEYRNVKMPEGSGKTFYTAPSVTKTVKFVPANNVYYDDSFAGINYYGWETTSKAGGALVGASGTDEIYGNAGKEVNFSDDVHYVTGGTNQKASFSFYGSGVSVYMNTTANSGKILVNVWKADENGNKLPNEKAVASEYIDVSSMKDYKGVPVFNRADLDGKGNYLVQMTMYLPNATDVAYLNDIRVYGADIAGISYDETETNARFIELRDLLLEGADITAAEQDGVLYIDGTNGGSAVIGDYVKDGPKNEIYLAQNQGIAFKLDGALTGNQKIHVSARTLDGTATTMTAGAKTASVNSTVDMYFDITGTATDNVYVIKNTGAGILSLTNIKITNANDVNPVVNTAVAEQAIALFSMEAPVEPEVPETPDEPETPIIPQNPFEKFFNDIKNFFEKLFGIK